MIKYKIFQNEGGLTCRITEDDGSISYFERESEFKKFLSRFLSSGYKVKVNNEDVLLCTRGSVIILKDYERIISNEMLKGLETHVKRTVENYGVIDIAASRKVNKNPNRKKSSDFVKIATVGTVSLLLALNVMMGKLEVNHKSHTEPDKRIERIEERIEESFSDFSDISTTYKSEYANSHVENLEMEVEETEDMETGDKEEVIDFTSKTDNSLSAQTEETTEDIDTGYLEFTNQSSTEKAIIAKENYYEIFLECAKDYGLDANMLLAMATEERGVHSKELDSGGGLGLMQIQYDVWINKDLTYYKFSEETGKFEKDTIHITDEKLRDATMNIHIGSMILQNYLITSKYNIPVAIQMYNQGPGSISSIIKTYCSVSGADYDSVIENPEDLGWLDYRHLKKGDLQYLEKVNQWVSENTFTVKNIFTLEEVNYAFTSTKEAPTL